MFPDESHVPRTVPGTQLVFSLGHINESEFSPQAVWGKRGKKQANPGSWILFPLREKQESQGTSPTPFLPSDFTFTSNSNLINWL